jgi:hypothetical protein
LFKTKPFVLIVTSKSVVLINNLAKTHYSLFSINYSLILGIFTTELRIVYMNKYQVTVFFSVDEEFMSLVPKHRTIINELILKCVIDSYAISAEVGRGWITMNARDKSDIHKILERSPLYPYFELEIDQLMVYDSQMYRFPKMVLN